MANGDNISIDALVASMDEPFLLLFRLFLLFFIGVSEAAASGAVDSESMTVGK